MVAKKTFIALSMTLMTLPTLTVAAGGRGTSTPYPVIVSAHVVPNTDQVTIRGYAFGTEAPMVILGEKRLAVRQSGEKEIVATLPVNMPTATYSLLVVRNKTLQSQPFTLLVLAD